MEEEQENQEAQGQEEQKQQEQEQQEQMQNMFQSQKKQQEKKDKERFKKIFLSGCKRWFPWFTLSEKMFVERPSEPIPLPIIPNRLPNPSNI